MARTVPPTHLEIGFFIPNLIGYARFGFLFACPYFANSETHWHFYVICYSLSQMLDAADGKAARAFDQCSRFGAALDMVCDRASNALNFLTLAMLYPSCDYLFFLCFILDFGSHFLQFQMAAVLKMQSHKGMDEKVNWLVNLYYKNYAIFVITVCGTEVGAVLLFLNAKMVWL